MYSQPEQRPLTLTESCAVGAFAAAGEVVFPGQILTYGMNQAIKGHHFVPENCYRGFTANAIGEMPIGAAQKIVQTMLSAYTESSQQEELSVAQKMLISYLAGVAGACIDTPSSMIQLYVQDDLHAKKTFWRAAIELRSKAFRGFLPNAFIKEGIFCCGYQSLATQTEKLVGNYTDNQPTQKIIGGIGAGLITAMLTQPGAVLRNKMQNELLRPNQQLSTLSETITNHYKTEGLRGFWKGFRQRGSRITIAVPLYSAYSNFLEKQLRSYHKQP